MAETRYQELGGHYASPYDSDNDDAHVRTLVVPQESDWDSVTDFDCCNYGNTDDPDFDMDFHQGQSPDGLCKHQRAEAERANRDGVYGIVAQYKHPLTGKWEDAGDSVWGFIGDDYDESGYDSDVADAAVTAYEKALQLVSYGDVLALA